MRVIKFGVLLMALACVPLLSHAAEIKMTSSTQYLWYQDLVADQGQRDVAEYLRLNVTKLDKEGKVNVYGYGRASNQLATSNDAEGRLYYLYMDYRDVLQDHLDMRLGRTYVNATALSGTVDGVHFDAKNLGPFGVTVFGGRNVLFDAQKEYSTRGELLYGTSVYLDTVKNTHLEVSYGRKYTDTDLARENVGFDFSTTPVDYANVYGRLKYDTIAEAYNEMLFGLKVAAYKDLILRGEFYQSYPTFDIQSIYSVFAVDQYQEKSLAAEYRVNDKYRVSLKYAREDFGKEETADLYEVALLARPIKDLTLNVSYEKRNGYAGELNGVRLSGEYKINKASLLAGMDYDDFRREASRKDQAKKYWAGVDYAFNKIVSALVRVEDNINFNYENSYQGYAAVQITY
jgi:hypothetical protein